MGAKTANAGNLRAPESWYCLEHSGPPSSQRCSMCSLTRKKRHERECENLRRLRNLRKKVGRWRGSHRPSPVIQGRLARRLRNRHFSRRCDLVIPGAVHFRKSLHQPDLTLSYSITSSTDSATTERTPPEPASRADVVMRWTKRMTKSLISASYKNVKIGRNSGLFCNSPPTRFHGLTHLARSRA